VELAEAPSPFKIQRDRADDDGDDDAIRDSHADLVVSKRDIFEPPNSLRDDERRNDCNQDRVLHEKEPKSTLFVVKQWLLLSCVVLASATMFSLVHYPHRWLMLATFTIGLPWSIFYLKQRNLFPLGFYHGVVGACFYFWWLQKNPLPGV